MQNNNDILKEIILTITRIFVIVCIVFVVYAVIKYDLYNRTYNRIMKEELNKIGKIRGEISWGKPTKLKCESYQEYLTRQVKKWLRRWAELDSHKKAPLLTYIWKNWLKKIVIWYLGTENNKTIRVQTQLEEYIRNKIREQLYTPQELIDWDFHCFINVKEEYWMDWWIEEWTITEELMEERIILTFSKMIKYNFHDISINELEKEDKLNYKIYTESLGREKCIKDIKRLRLNTAIESLHLFKNLLYENKNNEILQYLSRRTLNEIQVIIFPEQIIYSNYSLDELKAIREPLIDFHRFFWKWLHNFEDKWNNSIKKSNKRW